MIGDARVVFLDEPTSGVSPIITFDLASHWIRSTLTLGMCAQMDPFSRRSFWSFLKKRKEGRVIILTTHM